MIFRQGDVLIRKVDAIPEAAKQLERDELGRVVLAYGEVTGHAHAFHSPKVVMFRDDGSGGRRFIDVQGLDAQMLQHEEHTAVTVPPGQYEVIQQREYVAAAVQPRYVAD